MKHLNNNPMAVTYQDYSEVQNSEGSEDFVSSSQRCWALVSLFASVRNYNVNSYESKEKNINWEGVSKLLIDSVYTVYSVSWQHNNTLLKNWWMFV